MIEFPDSTRVHRKIPKEAFYKHLPLTAKLKASFVTDVDSIYVEYSLTNESLRLDKKSEAEEILVLKFELKRQNLDGKILEAIARQNAHRLVFILCRDGKTALAVYYSKLYRSEWYGEEELSLKLSGFSLDEMWEAIVEQIAIGPGFENRDRDKLDDELKKLDQIKELQKQIEITEAAAWKEQQPKKRFELYGRVQKYKKELEEIQNG